MSTHLVLASNRTFPWYEIKKKKNKKPALSNIASPVAQLVKNPPAKQETPVPLLGWEDPSSRKWQPTPIFLPGAFHGQRSLVGYSPWGRKESDVTELLTLSLFNSQT